jgi:iron complex transport system substrate-binding protein
VAAVLALVAAAGVPSMGAAETPRPPLRILSLDQCADQFALGLSAPGDVLFLSPRADDPDSHLRDLAGPHARVRPTLEAALTAQPDVVIRYWGGEPRLLRALQTQGVRVAQIDDATDLEGVRQNVRQVAEALDAPQRGRARLAEMDARLNVQAPARPSPALYLTAGGFTTGPGALIDALMRAAGLSNVIAAPGYAPVSVEQLMLSPPTRLVLAFFEARRADWRGAGRHPVVRSIARRVPTAHVEAAVAGCPAWFVAEAVQQMRQGS